MKQLVEDGRYDYIETEPLISIRKNVEGIVVPSEERSLRLTPLDFEEFLATCYNVGDPSVGLAASADESSFKCYLADTGLLVSQLFADNDATPHEVYRYILHPACSAFRGLLSGSPRGVVPGRGAALRLREQGRERRPRRNPMGFCPIRAVRQ